MIARFMLLQGLCDLWGFIWFQSTQHYVSAEFPLKPSLMIAENANSFSFPALTEYNAYKALSEETQEYLKTEKIHT